MGKEENIIITTLAGLQLDVANLKTGAKKSFGLMFETNVTLIQFESNINERIDCFEDKVQKRFDGVEQRLDGIEQRFDGIEQRFDEIIRLLKK